MTRAIRLRAADHRSVMPRARSLAAREASRRAVHGFHKCSRLVEIARRSSPAPLPGQVHAGRATRATSWDTPRVTCRGENQPKTDQPGASPSDAAPERLEPPRLLRFLTESAHRSTAPAGGQRRANVSD